MADNNDPGSDGEGNISPFIYSDEETVAVQEAIAGHAAAPDELMTKIQSDPLVHECGAAIFFPVIRERVMAGERPIVQELATGARARAMKVTFEDGTSYIIKATENSQEPAIAELMGQIGVGPKQFQSLDGHITEEYIEGTAISQLEEDRCTPEFMAETGKKIGAMIRAVHDQGVVVNDQLLSDDWGKSHTIVMPNGDVRFIDFGAAIDVRNYPDLSDEAVMLMIKSDGMAMMRLQMMQSDEQVRDYIAEYRKTRLMQDGSRQGVISRIDGQLLNEGFSFLSMRTKHIGPLAGGIIETLDGETN